MRRNIAIFLLTVLLQFINIKKIKIMTYKEANNISIKDYLNSLEIQPVTEKGSYGMYRSPLREDNTPSFKVDYNANLWCDYGTGEGGTLIDLVMKQNGCNAYGAICRLEQGDITSFSFHGKDLPERDTKRQAASPIEIRRIQPLQNPALMRYLQERGISPGTAAPYVQEMYYRIGGKPYFALAFRNDSGGYELRNPRFKGSTSKDITHIRQKGEQRDTCFVFEGFMDYLSFLTIQQQKSPGMPCTDWQDYVSQHEADRVTVLRNQEASRGSRAARQRVRPAGGRFGRGNTQAEQAGCGHYPQAGGRSQQHQPAGTPGECRRIRTGGGGTGETQEQDCRNHKPTVG